MFTSFSTALSGLNANSTAIDVVGNNLANLNTTGFKTTQVEFQSLVTQSLGAGLGDTQVGFGTGEPLTTMEFSQGAIQTTSGTMDAAVQGDGFFVVADPSGNTMYTRAGNFKVDKSGNLMTDTGDYVQGWTTASANGGVNTNGSVGNIVVPVGSLSPPAASTKFSVELNLNSSATVYSATDTSSDFSTPISVYDSLGNSHVLTLDFQKTGSNAWTYNVTIPGADLGTTDAATSIATGSLAFTSNGVLDSGANPSPVALTVSGLSDGASDLALNWNLFNGTASDITQFAQPSAPSATSKDGTAAAELVNVGLGNGGAVLAQYSNGTQVMVGQVAMASVRNPDTLIAMGNNNFQASSQTANPSIGMPGTGGRGDIVGGSLEASTVDIASQFTNLMVYQRAYEADSKVVTTADTLSQDTINLIR